MNIITNPEVNAAALALRAVFEEGLMTPGLIGPKAQALVTALGGKLDIRSVPPIAVTIYIVSMLLTQTRIQVLS